MKIHVRLEFRDKSHRDLDVKYRSLHTWVQNVLLTPAFANYWPTFSEVTRTRWVWFVPHFIQKRAHFFVVS